jgi:hypothetical protein
LQLEIVTAPIYLANGQIVFTQFEDTIIPMPTGDYAVLSLQVTPPPLITTADHHRSPPPLTTTATPLTATAQLLTIADHHSSPLPFLSFLSWCHYYTISITTIPLASLLYH